MTVIAEMVRDGLKSRVAQVWLNPNNLYYYIIQGIDRGRVRYYWICITYKQMFLDNAYHMIPLTINVDSQSNPSPSYGNCTNVEVTKVPTSRSIIPPTYPKKRIISRFIWRWTVLWSVWWMLLLDDCMFISVFICGTSYVVVLIWYV